MKRHNVRRGSLLLGVLIVVMIASMVGLSMMSAASIHRGEARGALRRAQSRALAWSGVLAIVSQMETQRAEILAGTTPNLKRAWSLGDGSVIRLIAPTASSSLVVSESAKLDVNLATAEMLDKLEGLPTGTAPRIVQARNDGAFESAEELTRVSGLSANVLYGEAARPTVAANEASRPPDGEGPSGMLSRLTVFSTDGLYRASADGPDLRIRCATAWSEEDRRRAGLLLGEELATGLDAAVKSSKGFKDETSIVQTLRRLKVEPKQWDKVLDGLTPATGNVSAGKVDVNLATADVLAAIPGIGVEQAAALVSARESLSSSLRTGVAWPVVQGVLTEDGFERAVNWLTARSTMWRVRVEAGFRRNGESDGVDEWEDTPIGDRSALEAVIDITDEQVRVAYLRDVTYLETELTLEESGRTAAESPSKNGDEVSPPEVNAVPKPPRLASAASPSGRLSIDRLQLPKEDRNGGSAGGADVGATPSGSASKADRIGRWTRGERRRD